MLLDKCCAIDLGVVLISDAGFSFPLTGLALLTINDVLGRDPLERPSGVFPATLGLLHLERPLKFQFTAFEGSFQVKCPHRSWKDPPGFQGVFPCDIQN